MLKTASKVLGGLATTPAAKEAARGSAECSKQVYETFRKAVIAGRLLRVAVHIERDGPVVHLIAERIEDMSPLLTTLGRPVMIEANDGRADETKRPVGGSVRSALHPRDQAKVLFPSRDFH